MVMEKREMTVARLADLARLFIAREEAAQQERDFHDILAFVAQIEKVPATAQPLTTTVSGVSHVLREDVMIPSSLADALLAVAPERRERFIRVPVIL